MNSQSYIYFIQHSIISPHSEPFLYKLVDYKFCMNTIRRSNLRQMRTGYDCDIFDELGFSDAERCAIGFEDVMEPFFRHWIARFRPPRIVSLSSAEHEAPVDSPHAFAFEHGKMCDKCRAQSTCHIFSADDGSVVFCVLKWVLLSLLMLVLVHSTSQQAWKVMTSLSVRMNSLIGSNSTPPFHQPEVIGWLGLAERAHSNTFTQNGRLLTNLPELPTSLYRSHITTASEFLKVPMISTTQLLRVAQGTSTQPGHCTHWELWMPGKGSGCLPSAHTPLQQSSKRTGIT